ncbi:MAG TPA: hypothetical protein VGI39_42805, partial [Polyangiaceae bacterium]
MRSIPSSATLLALSALALDAGFVAAFVARPDPWLGSIVLALGHVAASVGFGIFAQALFPASYRERDLGFVALAASVALLVPVLGPVGLLGALAYALRRPRHERPVWSDLLEIPSLLHQVPRPPATISFSADALAQILGGNAPNDRRFRAILATRSLAPRQAIPLLKIALADASDEVRLLG